MITCLIISFIVCKIFGKNIFFKKEPVKAPMREEPLNKGHI
jgi:hypothetical protein